MSLKSHLSYFSALNNDINNTKRYFFKSQVGFRHTLLQVSFIEDEQLVSQFLRRRRLTSLTNSGFNSR